MWGTQGTIYARARPCAYMRVRVCILQSSVAAGRKRYVRVAISRGRRRTCLLDAHSPVVTRRCWRDISRQHIYMLTGYVAQARCLLPGVPGQIWVASGWLVITCQVIRARFLPKSCPLCLQSPVCETPSRLFVDDIGLLTAARVCMLGVWVRGLTCGILVVIVHEWSFYFFMFCLPNTTNFCVVEETNHFSVGFFILSFLRSFLWFNFSSSYIAETTSDFLGYCQKGVCCYRASAYGVVQTNPTRDYFNGW